MKGIKQRIICVANCVVIPLCDQLLHPVLDLFSYSSKTPES